VGMADHPYDEAAMATPMTLQPVYDEASAGSGADAYSCLDPIYDEVGHPLALRLEASCYIFPTSPILARCIGLNNQKPVVAVCSVVAGAALLFNALASAVATLLRPSTASDRKEKPVQASNILEQTWFAVMTRRPLR
jgi:hypothetical protein